MKFATGFKLSWNREKSRRSTNDHRRIGNTRSLILMEIILRPALSIFMCTAASAATRWKDRLKHFAPFAISTRAAARHRFCSRQRQRLSRKSSRSYKRLANVDQRSARLPGSSRRAVYFKSESWSATHRVHSGPLTGCRAAIARIRRRIETCNDRARTAGSTRSNRIFTVLTGSA